MQIKTSQELYAVGLARREHEEPDLAIDPEQAEAVHVARELATKNYAVNYIDSVGKALLEAANSGRAASFLEFYQGPLSDSVLASLIEVGTLPDAETI